MPGLILQWRHRILQVQYGGLLAGQFRAIGHTVTIPGLDEGQCFFTQFQIPTRNIHALLQLLPFEPGTGYRGHQRHSGGVIVILRALETRESPGFRGGQATPEIQLVVNRQPEATRTTGDTILAGGLACLFTRASRRTKGRQQGSSGVAQLQVCLNHCLSGGGQVRIIRECPVDQTVELFVTEGIPPTRTNRFTGASPDVPMGWRIQRQLNGLWRKARAPGQQHRQQCNMAKAHNITPRPGHEQGPDGRPYGRAETRTAGLWQKRNQRPEPWVAASCEWVCPESQ